MKTIALGPFLGINNRLPDFALRIRTRQLSGDFLRSAINVDVDNSGNLRSRRATERTTVAAGAHSLTSGYYVQGGAIYTLAGVFVKLLSNNNPVNWVKSGSDLYYSNDVDTGRITGGAAYPLALPTPDSPAFTTIGGSLEPGWYQLGVSYARYDGATLLEEGGVSASSNHELAATGGFCATLPASVPGATHVHVYLSRANGEVPYLLASVAIGTATYDCTAHAAGRESPGRYEEPLPAGTLFMSNNRLCSFSGSRVYVGLPYRHGYCLSVESYIDFAEPVTLAVENQGGTYIATATATRWFPGDLGDVKDTVVDVLPYGAVPGTVFRHPTEPKVGWFGSKGFVLADAGGTVNAVTEDNVDVNAPASGCSAVVDLDGYRRVVSCGYCMNLENSAVTTYTGWDFNSVSDGLGCKSDGIYLLNSVGLVDASFSLGKQNFGTEEVKYMPAVYAGVASATAMELTVGYVDDNGDARAYEFPTRGYGTELQIRRFDTAKGMRSSWFDLSIRNTEGSDFTLASISFAPATTSRRI